MANPASRKRHSTPEWSRHRTGAMAAIAISMGFMPGVKAMIASDMPDSAAQTATRHSQGDKTDESGGHGSSCTAAADTLFHACRQRVNDDFFGARAICINLAKSGEREKCYAEARTKRVEGRQLCHVQLASRRSACVGLGDERYPRFDRQPSRPASTSCRIPTAKACLRFATVAGPHFTGSFDHGCDFC